MYEIRIPESGFSLPEATIAEWVKKPGDPVQAGETVVILETDKLSVEVPAEGDGVLHEIRYDEGETVPVGTVIGTVEASGRGGGSGAGSGDRVRSQPGSQPRRSPAGTAGFRRVSPLAKSLAREHGISIQDLPDGTGPHGRIVKDDVLAYVSSLAGKTEGASAAGQASAAGHGDFVPFTGWRKTAAERLTESFRNIPHFGLDLEIDVTGLSDFLASLKQDRPEHRFTYLVFVIKALSQAVQVAPEVNAHCRDDGFQCFDEVHIGVAVDLGEKLVVPVLRDVREKSIIELADELESVIARARDGKLEPGDMTGATITITNIGVYGVRSGFALIVPPQTAILYMGAAYETPGFVRDQVEPRRKMIIGGSFDHRVVQGAQGGRFLHAVKEMIERPERMLLSLR